MTEEELLDWLCQEKLGKGIAKFRVGVGSKFIDLVFEKEGEIWIIEAEKKLNFSALGQVLTYKPLYQEHFSPSKPLRLGIVCEEGNEDIEKACRKEGVKVFIVEKVKEVPKVEEAPICGVCGSQMKLEAEEYKCKTCDHYFGMSSLITKCPTCGAKFGNYSDIEEKTTTLVLETPSNIRAHWRKGICPQCRGKKFRIRWRTIADLIKDKLTERRITRYQLEKVGLPPEFIDYCLGKEKPYG